MSGGKKRKSHSLDAVWRRLRARYGDCPELLAEEIVRRVCERTWAPPIELGPAIDKVAASLVRHRLTEYERLYEVKGLTREEARLIVAPEVEAIIASWKRH